MQDCRTDAPAMFSCFPTDVQSTSTSEYLNWKMPSGLVNVRSVVCADKEIDSPQKQIAISVFIWSAPHYGHDAREIPDACGGEWAVRGLTSVGIWIQCCCLQTGRFSCPGISCRKQLTLCR